MHLVAYSFSQCLMPTVYDWFHYSPIFPILQGKSIDFIEFSLILTLFLPIFPFPRLSPIHPTPIPWAPLQRPSTQGRRAVLKKKRRQISLTPFLTGMSCGIKPLSSEQSTRCNRRDGQTWAQKEPAPRHRRRRILP